MYGGNGHFQYLQGNNCKSRKTRVTVHMFCMSSHCGNICVKFHENMSSGLKLWRRHKNCKHTKGNNSKSRKTRITVQVFCTLSYGVNVCVKFHENMSSCFKVMEWKRKLLT